ncbi:hypothetical protein HZ994_14045 [Akkermansiaceae bacterium]|nr:hypothetical protein HZ994_14045 [Akkermansiaceae bacterium]
MARQAHDSISLPTLADNKTWDTYAHYTTGFLTVVPEPSADDAARLRSPGWYAMKQWVPMRCIIP